MSTTNYNSFRNIVFIMEDPKQDFKADNLTAVNKTEMEKHAGFDQTNIKDHYDELSSNYESVYLTAGWPDPTKSAELANEFVHLSPASKADAEVFDMGCGTGLVGQYLTEFGFTKVDGVDASKGMLDQAEVKKCYRLLEELFLGVPETFPQKFHNKYDVVTASGILADNHLDCPVFEEMLLALKTGGIVTFTSRIEYLEKYGYGPYMEKLETEGKWKLLKREEYTKYDKLPESVGRFKPTQSYVFCYQKL
jgi:predicted TPR repeat methyltransferase